MVKLGIIGHGYWGPNLLRNFYGQSGCEVVCVADSRQNRLDLVKKSYPTVKVVADHKAILNDPSIDAVVIAVPVFLHYAIAKEALQKGKHILVEKPMTTSSKEAEELIKLAKKNKKVIMVDHTFLYTGAVQKIKSIIEKDGIGTLKYFDSVRINLGLFQPDINVLWDLAPHDISILNYLVKEQAVSVQATGISHTDNGIENIAYLTVNYQSNFIAHFSCSWSSPVKIRKILIGGTKKMIMFDDMEPTEKVKIYDTGYSVTSDEDKRRILVDYRAGDIYLPKIVQREALSAVAADFIEAIRKGRRPVSDELSGLQAVQLLEAAQKSIKQKGKEIKLEN